LLWSKLADHQKRFAQLTCFYKKVRKLNLADIVINTLFFYENVVFPAQAEYSYFSADFRLKIFLYYQFKL